MNPRILLLVIFLTAVFVARAAPPPAFEPLRAVFIRGKTTLTNNQSTIVTGQIFKNGDTLKTDPNTYLDLEGTDLSLRMNPETELLIEKFESADRFRPGVAIRLKLLNGSILCNVKKLSAASSFEVRTPKGIAFIRGTSFFLEANGECRVYDGTIAVMYMAGTGEKAVPSPVIMLNPGRSSEPPIAPGQQPIVTEISPDMARTLGRDFDDLKKHRVRKAR